MRDPVVVLKFGSSVLRDEAALPAAVLEIYREIRRGRRVVAVVSAFGMTTDTLLRSANEHFERPDPRCLARLLETGEARAAACLGLALEQAGVPSEILDWRQTGLRTAGPVEDAEPVDLDAQAVHRVLADVPVVVTPGFVGHDEQGRPNLLGRGGSDLTALFLAHRLEAVECRLLKDVDGLLKVNRDGSLDHATRYAQAHYAECLRVGGPLIQPKAVEFAEQNGLAFTIARCGTGEGTVAGPVTSRFERTRERPHRLRVALAGLGTVGLGVFRWLNTLEEDFEVVGVLVKDRDRRRPVDVRPDLLVFEPEDLLACDPELVIEVIGGTDTATELITAARARGVPVVSANKQLLALDPDLLRPAIDGDTRDLVCSAAVGGGVPALETVAAVLEREPVVAVEGVLNGTCNFVLDRCGEGHDLDDAVAEAQELGLAEADPHLDVSGLDALYKLALLASLAFDRPVSPEDIICEGLDQLGPDRIVAARKEGKVLKLVAEARRSGGDIVARVDVRALAPDGPLAGCRGEGNTLLVETASGRKIRLDGKGAGRWPTTVSVVGDALQVRRDLVSGRNSLDRRKEASS